MTNLAAISVVIPFFNAHETIGETLASVVAQEFDHEIEIIVVDDLSATPFEPPAIDDPRITISSLRNERNSGPAASRNRGLKLARAPYVCFLDADDMYGPGFFAYGYAVLQGNDLFAALSTGVEILAYDGPINPIQMKAIEGSLPSNLMTRRAVLNLIGGFPEAKAFRGRVAGEDCALRFVLNDFFVQAKAPEPFFKYRNRPGSHLEHFLQRSVVEGGALTLSDFAAEEASGEMSEMIYLYREEVRARLGALRHLNPDMLMALAAGG
jgi:glycosyltransferase involved in cell wall biosynthesis